MNWFKKAMIGITLPSLLVVSACGGGGTATQEAGGQAGGAPAKQTRTLKAGIGLNEDHPQGQGLKKFAELVEQKSGGSMKVQTYFAAQLGDDLKMTNALKSGTQEITIPSTSPLTSMVKEFGVFDYPFVFNNEQEADAVLDGPVGKKLLDMLPQQGLIGLTYWENGFRNLTNSKRPVAAPEDFQGLKIRTLQSKVHIEAFSALGANPTPMPFSEVFSALEGKTVDGQENPLPTIESNKFYEVQKYLSLTNHVYTPFVFLVSKKFWDGLTPDEQKILQEASIEAGKFQREKNREQNKQSLENLKSKGIEVNEVKPEDREKMQEIVKPVLDKFSKDLGEALVKEMYDEVNKVRGK
ncbi:MULTISPECIES: TRAP transporter substrate-binding protein [Paenibacillus]|uniref:TRAP transporter substrate-binding protein n=1 Tax=Paenibacillus TaxID=44249 RepID=UPI0008802609|nr:MULTISPECIES: TRAP transporter substrate-binding protein [Paenibacillus]GCL74017.1 TRAP transporter substrate-binding protein [Paenibacillus naphthalenovorans]SDJ69151.1 tripartite ATP-independent transporter solute receptor, DctP family [Paenibacillus naphthalenovorans]